MTLSARDVCAPFNSRRALNPDSPPPPAPKQKEKAPRRSVALLVPCPECKRVQGDWCVPDSRAVNRDPIRTKGRGERALHQARIDLVSDEVTAPFDPEQAIHGDRKCWRKVAWLTRDVYCGAHGREAGWPCGRAP